MGVDSFEKEKELILSFLKERILEYNMPRLKELEMQSRLTICVGSGVSADVNKAVNKHSYLWNGLVYGIAGKLFEERITSTEFIKFLQQEENLPLSSETVNKYRELAVNALSSLVKKEKFLSSDNTMECVEYLKYIAFDHESGAPEDNYAENVMAIIVNDLFNIKRISANNINDPIRKEIRKEYKASYSYGIYQEGRGKTLIELAELLIRMKNAEVLTYNYDDYLETALATRKYDPKKIHSIYNEITSTQSPKSGVRIYHVHGFIPKGWEIDKKISDFIFSEVSYNHISNEIYRWANRIQADIFNQNRTLFVGFSGTDLNFRRLMKEIKKERMRVNDNCIDLTYHTMFMGYGSIINEICTDTFFDEIYENTSSYELSNETFAFVASQIIADIIEAKDRYYKEQLGIQLLWYNDVSEIPDMLNKMYRV